MPNIRVDLESSIVEGQPVTFESPASCSGITGLIVYYPENGAQCSMLFQFADAHGNNVGNTDLFSAGVLVKVILHLGTQRAYVQNADTNAYLEGRFEEIKAGAVKKSGDTMTGNLAIKNASPVVSVVDTDTNTQGALWQGGNQTILSNRNESGSVTNQRSIVINNSAMVADLVNALRFYETVEGAASWYSILHTGNSNRTKLVAEATTPANEGEIYWRYK